MRSALSFVYAYFYFYFVYNGVKVIRVAENPIQMTN